MAGKHRANDRPSTAETIKLISAVRQRGAEIEKSKRENAGGAHRAEDRK